MTQFVIDASVAVTWFYRERHSVSAAALLDPGTVLLAPQFLRIETASALLKRVPQNDLSLFELEEALYRLDRIGMHWTADEDLVRPAARLAADHRHSIYDCLYLALAQKTSIPLATIDRDLARLAGRLSPRVSVNQGLLTPH